MITSTVIKNVEITDLEVDVRQITRIIEGKQVMGPAGDVFDVERTFSDDDHYVGTALSDAQIAIGAFKKYLSENTEVTDAELLYFFGATNIPDDIFTWAAAGNTAW